MKNKLEKNKHYKLKMNLFGRIEEYEGTVQSLGEDEFRFETNDDNTCRALTLRYKDIIYSKEIEKPKEEIIHKISNKKKFTNLKPSPIPEFRK